MFIKVENKEDFASMLIYKDSISYPQAIELCHFVEVMYEKYEMKVTLESLVELLIKMIKVCIKYMKYHNIHKDRKVGYQTTSFYNKLYNSDMNLLPIILSNYDKLLVVFNK